MEPMRPTMEHVLSSEVRILVGKISVVNTYSVSNAPVMANLPSRYRGSSAHSVPAKLHINF